MVKFSFYSKLMWGVSTLYGRRKLLEYLILIVVNVTFKYFAFLSYFIKAISYFIKSLAFSS